MDTSLSRRRALIFNTRIEYLDTGIVSSAIFRVKGMVRNLFYEATSVAEWLTNPSESKKPRLGLGEGGRERDAWTDRRTDGGEKVFRAIWSRFLKTRRSVVPRLGPLTGSASGPY